MREGITLYEIDQPFEAPLPGGKLEPLSTNALVAGQSHRSPCTRFRVDPKEGRDRQPAPSSYRKFEWQENSR